ncbi:response regulator transcription factor [Paenirhodobacter enshiensis]|uniref:response regulator transcription factor n=1 Tax=Paenirhodobacter enshiensis TaxID=1105367 RepID=UPI003FA26584
MTTAQSMPAQSSRARILIVDDEPQIRRFLTHAFEAAGYEPLHAGSGAEALAQCAAQAPDLVILDLGLPDMDGKAVLEALHRDGDVPVIVLSARDSEMEKIMALDLGASDFVTKPFGIGELLARIRASLRHRAEPAAAEGTLPGAIVRGALRISVALRTVEYGGTALHLTPKEYELLVVLVQNSDRVMTHGQLLAQVWGPAHAGDVTYLRVFIGQLRQKLAAAGATADHIHTELGIGYRWKDS